MDALERNGGLTGRDGRPRLRYLTLFSGIEAATAAFERIGADVVPVAFCEIDAAANAVLRHRWPDVPRIGDVTSFDWSRLRGRVDCVLAGPPCQSFSGAGKRRGLHDHRGSLSIHAIRAIGAIQPRYFVIENVVGFQSSNGGEGIEALADAAGKLGYAFASRTLDARYFGLPQTRPRLWIVGERSRDPRGPREILDLQQCEGRPEIARGTEWQKPARRFEGRTGDMIPVVDIDWSDRVQWTNPPEPTPGVDPGDPAAQDPDLAGSRVLGVNFRNWTVSDIAPCLQTKSNSLNSNPCVLVQTADGIVTSRFSPKEALRLQGFDDDWLDGPVLKRKPLSDMARFRLVGNSWPIPVAAWILSGLLLLFRGPATVAVWYGWRRRMPFVPTAGAFEGAVPANDDRGIRQLPAAGGVRSFGDIATMVREAADRYHEAA